MSSCQPSFSETQAKISDSWKLYSHFQSTNNKSQMKKVMDRIEKLMGLDSDIENDNLLDEENVSRSGNESSKDGRNETYENSIEIKSDEEDSKIENNGDYSSDNSEDKDKDVEDIIHDNLSNKTDKKIQMEETVDSNDGNENKRRMILAKIAKVLHNND